MKRKKAGYPPAHIFNSQPKTGQNSLYKRENNLQENHRVFEKCGHFKVALIHHLQNCSAQGNMTNYQRIHHSSYIAITYDINKTSIAFKGKLELLIFYQIILIIMFCKLSALHYEQNITL